MKLLIWLLSFLTITAYAQTVLDGDKVTRVGAPRNYVRNPNAQVNILQVTASNATVTRSTTTPISDIGTEFNVNITNNNGTATWTLNTFSQGLKGALCEARFRYRAATSTTLFQVLQGANVVAQVAPVVDSTNTTLGSIPFPCGDLSSATTFRVTATAATLPTALEVADIYVGQVVSVGEAGNITAWQSYTPTVSGFAVSTISAEWRRIGDTLHLRGRFTTASTAGTAAQLSFPSTELLSRTPGGLDVTSGRWIRNTGGASSVKGGNILLLNNVNYISFASDDYTGANSPFAERTGAFWGGAGEIIAFDTSVKIANWASTNLAVTPGSQNVWGARNWVGQSTVTRNTNAWDPFSNATYASNVTNIGTATACGSANDLCIRIPNAPAGSYKVTLNAPMLAGPATECGYALSTTNGSGGIFSSGEAEGDAATNNMWKDSIDGAFTKNSFGDLEIYVLGNRLVGANNCSILGGTSPRRYINLTVTRLDTANTQPVFIQSPVRAAQTGVAPLAGEVGQLLENGPTLTNLFGSGVYGDVASVTLTTGVWSVTGCVIFQANGATVTTVYAGLGTASGSSTTGLVFGDTQFETLPPTSSSNTSLCVTPTRYNVTGASQVVYLKARGDYSVATPIARGRITATRIGDR